MSIKPKANTCIEVSFECGNKVGGIHTVLTSKARWMKQFYGENYLTIGFFNPQRYFKEFTEDKPSKEMENIFKKLEPFGIKCHFGKWVVAENVPLILIDSSEFMKKEVNDIKAKLWEKFKIDSLRTGYDYDEPVAWSTAVGMLIEKLVNSNEFKKKKVIVHFHEWLSGAGLLYLLMKKVPVALVFTTHATRIGRAKSSAGENLFKEVMLGLKKKKHFNDDDAKKYHLEAQHGIEKACAHHSHVFTGVSDIVAEEAEYILGKRPDVVTPNGWDIKHSLSSRDLTILHEKNRKKINEFLEAYFSPYYPVETKNNIVFFISGRYEFFNKGIDIYIEALSKLNERLKNKKNKTTVFAFILVPSNIKGPKKSLLESILRYKEIEELVGEEFKRMERILVNDILDGKQVTLKDLLSKRFVREAKILSYFFSQFSGKNPPLCAFELEEGEYNDKIINYLIKNNLTNKKEDKVKVIFYPSYLSRGDGLLNMNYSDFVNGASMGIFPSRYEPWGYTPFETAILRTLVVTTDQAGFGVTIQKNPKDGRLPIKVLHMKDKSKKDVVEELEKTMEDCIFMEIERRTFEKLRARMLVKQLDWKYLIQNYINAHNLAWKNFMKSKT